MTRKLDLKTALRATTDNERSRVDERFAAAERVQAAGGLVAQIAAAARQAPDRPAVDEAPPPIVRELRAGGAATRAIPLELLDDNPFNARQIYAPEVIAARAASLDQHGQRVPAVVAANWRAPGRFILIDGQYRKRALRDLGRETMDCVVDERVATDLDLYRVSFLANEERHAQSALDNALAWRRLLDEHVVESEAALAALTGVSPANVNKTLALAKLSSAVTEQLHAHAQRFGIALGYEVYLYEKAAGTEACLRLIERIVAEELSSREVARLRELAVRTEPARRREVSRQWRIERDGVRVGTIRERDSGRIVLDVVMADASERARLLAELRKRFGLSE